MATERARARANIDGKTWRNGGKGKNGTTKDGAKISDPRARARARAKIDDKTWRKWGQGQKRHPEAKIGQKYEF